MFISASISNRPVGFRFTREPHFPFWTLSCLLKGSARVQCGKSDFLVEANHLILIGTNIPYRIEVMSPAMEIYAYFVPSTEIECLLNWPGPLPGFRILKFKGENSAPQIKEEFENMFNLANSLMPERLLFAENALERALLFSSLINPNQQYSQLDHRIVQLLAFIEGRIADTLTLNQLARKAHLSRSRFAHLFRKQMGKGPMEYVEERRMQEAQKLLVGTNQTVGEIAELCGFQNQFHFSTRFKKFTGKSPRSYRLNPLPEKGTSR